MQDPIKTSTAKLQHYTNFENGDISVAVLERVFSHIIKESKLNCEKVIVVAISGSSRSGKSFLLNLLLHYYKHHEREDSKEWKQSEIPIQNINWASGEDGITRGMWVCEKPLVVKTKDGEKVHIVLIDTQGLGDDMLSLNSEMDTLLLTSSLRFSDLTIFNVTGRTTSNDLNGLFSILRKWDALKSEKPLFNHLMFLYRDCQFTSNYGHQPNLFLEKVNRTKAKFSAEQNPYIAIQQAFRNTTSFTCPNPGEKIQKASEEDSLLLSDQNVNGQFLDTMKCLFDMILGFDVDDAYFMSLVDKAEHGYEVLNRLQTLKEWIEDDRNLCKKEELEHALFQNEVNSIFMRWREKADENLAATLKENKEFLVPSPAEFTKLFAEKTAIMNTLPFYSVYYKQLEDQIREGSTEYQEMATEYLSCKTPEERKKFFEERKMEALKHGPKRSSLLIKVLAGVAAASLVTAAAGGVAVGVLVPPIGIIELAIAGYCAAGAVGLVGLSTGVAAIVLKVKSVVGLNHSVARYKKLGNSGPDS